MNTSSFSKQLLFLWAVFMTFTLRADYWSNFNHIHDLSLDELNLYATRKVYSTRLKKLTVLDELSIPNLSRKISHD